MMALPSRTEYDARWASYRSGIPENWRGAHHGQPDGDFVALCAEAEEEGARVELHVGGTKLGRQDDEHRSLGPIVLRYGAGGTRVLAHIGVTISTGARAARETLARLLGGGAF